MLFLTLVIFNGYIISSSVALPHVLNHFSLSVSRSSRRSVAQSCLILCDSMDCNPPGSSVHGILQARILQWVAISFSGDLPHPGIKPRSPALQADFLPTEL